MPTPDHLTTAPPEVQALIARHDFQPTETITDGYCSTVYLDPTRALKIPTDGEEQTSGYHASYELQKVGGPKVIDGHQPTGTLLLERLLPGTRLTARPDEDDVAIFAHLAQQIWTLTPNQAVPLETYYTNPSELCLQLLKTTETTCFLHGDLHHDNILLHGTTWRPIDAKGIVGDPAFECAALLRNPINQIPHMNPQDLYNLNTTRIKRLAHLLNLDPYRIAAWSYVDRAENAQHSSPKDPWVKSMPVFERILKTFTT